MSLILVAKKQFVSLRSNSQLICFGTVSQFKPHAGGGKSGKQSHPNATTCHTYASNTSKRDS